MDRNNVGDDEPLIKNKKDEYLLIEINKVEEEITREKEKNKELFIELNSLKLEFETLKQSSWWKFLRKTKKGVSFIKKLVLCLIGKKSWYELRISGNPKSAEKRIKKIKYSLYELGFTKKALEELDNLVLNSNNFYLRRLAAWELALWHANQYSRESSEKCLKYLKTAMIGEKRKDPIRRSLILKAECYDLLGENVKGKGLLKKSLTKDRDRHPDLLLALANLEGSTDRRLYWINEVFKTYGLTKITLHSNNNYSQYDQLTTDQKDMELQGTQPKVSIIIPVYNAENVVSTSIESLLAQTWENIELLVVDDCSSDNTVSIIEDYVKKDPRVKLYRTKTNSGAYVARNIALKEASGEFVTINDADDWSHPQKIETQVKHLIENKSNVANTSQQARATEDLKLYRRGKPLYLFTNLSSLMFRREKVMDKLGYWDQVRFGADGEFKKRLKIIFGDKSVVDLPTGPLSFQRQTEGSLTGNSEFGYHGFFMGARKEYQDSYNFFHETADSLKYEFPSGFRPFPVPEPMLPERQKGIRHFDVIIASEFRLLGGTNMSNIEEIKAQKQFGLKTGLVQLNRYDFQSEKEINPKVRELIDGNQVQMLVYGENIICDVLIIRHPPILQEWQKYVPNVKAKSVNVIVNQPPKREYSENGKILFKIEQCVKNVMEYFGSSGKWYPIGPLIRETLEEHHAHELKCIKLSSEDWVNIIDINEWKRTKRPNPTSKIKIGRHSRSQYVKWPSTSEQLLSIYPDEDEFEVHILGGASVPESLLGYLPKNWHVLEFGQEEPKEFLAKLDVFVYYTHPDWVEAFGRVIFEAMAVGVPVIISPEYKNLFGEAAIYAEPHEVKPKIRELMKDDRFYRSQVEAAFKYVEENFGYTKHAKRIEKLRQDQGTLALE
ncbi:glycosyltransferase [Evansella tamaricis]|uniref:Glycosyltransferase n=1 Tax=Evansella tamaricis TaxID=2069301 RepID=A0ABS6JH11_9BACI|nr:glycosyltransferase [Evansella tamaricis]MBU9712949.1 glycosyltransferase [Evansella tamaricis]